MEKKVFCQHCNEEVPTYTVNRYGAEELCCLYCGLSLEQVKESNADGDRVSFKGKLLFADDSQFMREMLKEILGSSFDGIYEGFSDGESLITNFTKTLKENKKISLIILDLKMPYISGISSGIAVRAIEKAFDIKPAPILYFSAQKADEDLKKFMSHTPPSYYLNKGATNDINDLGSRLFKALKSILVGVAN